MQNLLAALWRLFFRPKSKPPLAWLDEAGEQLRGLPLTYVGEASMPYGKSATANKEPFKAIVTHHPAVPKSWSVERVIELINSPRGGKPIYFGYHFVIDTDGGIFQAAPLNKRTNHVKPARKRRDLGRHVTNRNSIGLCFHLASHNPEMTPNAAQIEAGGRLVAALEQVFGDLEIYGHGEIQTDRHANEGRRFAQKIRSENL